VRPALLVAAAVLTGGPPALEIGRAKANAGPLLAVGASDWPAPWGSAPPADRGSAMRRQVEHNPRDGGAWALLAMLEFEADRFERAVSTSPKVAADPAVRCEYADALGMAQGGSLAGRPTELIGCAPTTPSDRDGRQRRLRAA
jgi:cytochrome c-type biogenesis protein CcmH/NrfG